MHITRAYNSFQFNERKGTITKISKEDRLIDEINYYKSIYYYKNCSIYFPRFISSNTDKENSLELEYYAYNNLGDLMIYKEFDECLWENITKQLMYILDEFSKNKTPLSKFNLVKSMYIDKTEKYYNDLITSFKEFQIIHQHQNLKINGIDYLNFDIIWPKIKVIIEDHEFLSFNEQTIIHGDFCFSNILCGVNEVSKIPVLKLIDPRGSFGEIGVFGDPMYDYAKLYHSFVGGYENIIFDKFCLTYNKRLDSIDFILLNDKNLKKIEEVFKQYDIFNSLKVKLICGLIFIGMCSRHYDSLYRQIIMYCTGIKMLNEFLNEYEKNS